MIITMTYWYNDKQYVRLRFDSSSLRNLVDREYIVTTVFNENVVFQKL